MRFPFYPLGFALFPVLALLAVNIREVDAGVALRPLLISVTATVVVLIILRAVLRSWHKAALLTTSLLILFFSYGHLYRVVKNVELSGFVFGRHRYLVPALGALYVAFAWWVIRRVRTLEGVTRILNLTAVVLLTLPLVQLGSYALQAQSTRARIEAAGTGDIALSMPTLGGLPDIYYIVLDSYTRADALERDFGFDNRPFLDELRKLGFYVAECSRTNYSNTKYALSSVLNMRYMSKQDQQLLDLGDPSILLRESLVRQALEDIGYKTVAFETGYEWSRIKNAEFYLSPETKPLIFQQFDPFESMLVNSTVALVIADFERQTFAARAQDIEDVVPQDSFPLERYAEGQLYILDHLPEIPRLSDPTFAFVHLMTTHVPFVFDSNGQIWADEGFYYGDSKEPLDEWYWRVGYTNAIEFTNRRMLEILRSILSNSPEPPIILMQGDHGLRDENRLLILNAYYLPDDLVFRLHPSISPVNSFRVIFDGLFGTNFGLVQDFSYWVGSSDAQPEVSPDCLDIQESDSTR